MKVIQLSGGGLDSNALTIIHGLTIDQIYHIDYKQACATLEFESIVALKKALNLPIPLEQLTEDTLAKINPNSSLLQTGNKSSDFVVGRNLALTKRLADHLVSINPNENYLIYLGLCKEGMMFPDADPQFISLLNDMFTRSYGYFLDLPRIQVDAPFIGTLKRNMLGDALIVLKKYNCKSSILWDAFSCWTPDNGKECGICYHCVKKQQLKHLLGEAE